jgi:hypothetical protein
MAAESFWYAVIASKAKQSKAKQSKAKQSNPESEARVWIVSAKAPRNDAVERVRGSQ